MAYFGNEWVIRYHCGVLNDTRSPGCYDFCVTGFASMTETKTAFKEGLEDIVATSSSICYIDGDQGILSYRGYNIHDLAEHSSFEETAHLLWFGALPTRSELEETRRRMASSRALPRQVQDFLWGLPKDAVPMDVLRTAVSALGTYDPDAASSSPEANQRKAYRLTGQVASIVAAFHRLRQGKSYVEPRPELSHAANFLYMLNGEMPSTTAQRAFDIALILHAEHELNASTFAARVTAATLSDMHSAIVAGIGTLKGPLHGGANEAVMKILLEIGVPENAEAHLRKLLAAKVKVSGFGHRVYTTEDPRATHLRVMSEELGRQRGETRWFEMSRILEGIMKREKRINANVDFYSASLYYMLGIPIDLYTPVFAVSRITGWTAHVIEQHAHNRLIRPRADYTGAMPDVAYVPLSER
jgi:citrate synthase